MNSAGFGTFHPGEGRCYLHGGRMQTKKDRKILHISAKHPELAQRAQEILNSDNRLMSFKEELAVLKARFENMQVMLEDDADVPEMRRMAKAIADITSRVVEMEKVKDHWVHLTVVQSIVAAFSQVGQEYIRDPERRRMFVRDVERILTKRMNRNSATSVAAKAVTPGSNVSLNLGGDGQDIEGKSNEN